MAVFKATKNKRDTSSTFKATSQRSYDSTMVYDWETKNKEAITALNQYRERINSGGFMTADDLTAYRSALDNYVDSSTGLRRISSVFGGNSEDGDDDKWSAEISSMESGYESLSKYYSQWKTEDEYNSWLEQQKDYKEKSKLDLDAYEKEIAELEAQRASMDLFSEQGVKNFKDYVDNGGSADELESLVQEKKLYLENAKRIQEGITLAGVADPESENYDPDFKQYSGYASTELGNWWDKAWSQYGMGYDDLTYEYINNQNGIRDEIKNKHRVYGSDTSNPFFDGESSLEEEGYDYMTEDQVAIYNYYYAKDGKEAAEKYLDSIRESLHYQKAEGMYENMEDNTILELAFGVAAGLDQFESGMEGLFNAVTGNDAYVPQSATQMASGMVREDLGDEGFKILGNSLGQVGYDAVTTTSNMLPSVLTSTAVGIINPAAGSIVGTSLLGASSGGNAYQEMINLGYDKEQAGAYAAMVGASEAGLSYLLGGISKLGGKASGKVVTNLVNKVDNALARTAIKLGGNMASEFTEEYLQEVLTPWFQNIALGTDNDINLISSDALYSGLLGAITAGFIEGGSTISGEVNTYKTGKTLQGADISAQRLSELGKTFSADTVAYQLAGRVDENTGAYTLGRLFNEIGAELTEANKADVARELESRGVSAKDAKVMVDAMAAVVVGEEFTDKQIAMLNANDVLTKAYIDVIVNPNSTVNQRSQGYNQVISDLAKQKTAKEVTTNTTQTEPASQSEGNVTAENAVSAETETPTQSHYEAAVEGKTILKSTGDAVSIREVSSIKDGQMILKLEDGSEVNASDVAYSSQDEALVYEAVADMGVNASAANVLVNAYRTGSGVNAFAYSLGIKEAYRYGQYSYPVQELANGPFSSMLTDHQRQTAYKLGKLFGGKEVAKAEATVRKNRTVATNTTTGKVHFDGDRSNLTERQRASLSAMETVADALGVQIYVFESPVDANGKHTGANGWYDPKDGSIHIDLYAGANGESTMLFTVAHELTHFIKQWSPSKFKTLANFLMKEYGKKGVSIESLVQARIAKAKRNGRTISYDTAYEEVIADSMETMLSDGNVMEKLAKLKKRDKSLWQKIKDFITELAAKIRNVYEGLSPDSVEGRYVAEMKDSIEQLQELFTEGLTDAGQNFAGAQKNTTEDGGVKQSVRDAFYDEFDAWDKKDTNVTFTVGTTSEALLSIGMKDQKIILRSGTILQKLNKHKEMSFDIFKKIPELLEHPVIVQFSDAIDSKTQKSKYDSRITVLGELYADVKPALVSLELLPTNQKKTTVLDFAVITSAYGKNALQQYLNENSILYIDPDKKRTDSWLSLNRLQLPLGEKSYGPIRKIAYVDGKVKVQNSKNMTAMEKALFDAGVIDEFGNKKFSERDYSYDSLTNKPDMKVTTVGGNVPKNRADVAAAAKKNAARVGRLDLNEQLQELFTEGLTDAGQNFARAQKNTAQGGGETMFSLRGENKDGIEVYETSEEIKKLSIKERQKAFLAIMNEQCRGRTAKFIRNGHAYYAKFDYRDVSKNIYGDKLSDKRGWKAKINVGAEGQIFELVEHSRYDGSKPETGKAISAHSGVQRWDYFVKNVQIDGTVFDLVANVRNKADGSFVYSIQLNENKKIEASPSLDSQNSGLNRMLNASTDTASSDWPTQRVTSAAEKSAGQKGVVAKGNLATPTGEQAPINTPEASNGTVSSKESIRNTDENVNKKFSDRDYSYESLVSKPDMKVTTVGGNVPKNRADVAAAAKKNAVRVGRLDLNEQLQELFTEGLTDAGQNFARAQKNTAESGGEEVKFSSRETLSDAAKKLETISDEAYLKEKSQFPFVLVMDHTPQVVLDSMSDSNGTASAKNRKIIIRRDALYLAIRSSGIQEGHYHELGADVLSKLPDYLEQPDAILQTDGNESRRLVLTHIQSEKAQAIVSVEFESVKDFEGKNDYYNVIVTVFDLHQNYLKGLFKKRGAVIKYEKEDLAQVNPQLHKWLRTFNAMPSNSIIDDGGGDVNKKFSDRDYSYEYLVSKPDMKVTTVGGNVPKNRADVAAAAKKNAARVGRFDPKTGSVSVHVEDINADVILSTKGLRHGLRRVQDPLNAPNYVVTVKTGEILKNAIRINEITPSDDNAKSSYVLIGAARDANGTYVVRFVVNHFDNRIVAMDVLYAVNAKKELAATESPRLTAEPLSVTSSTISISELFDLVNQHFPDILPEDVLRHYGYDARPEGDLGEDALYSDRDTESVSNRSLLANAFDGVAQSDIEKRKLQEYKGKIDLINAEEQKLHKLNGRIKELSFAKGPREKDKIRSLRDEATKTANRINIYDKQLLRLEAAAPLQRVLEREKAKAYKRAEQKGKEAVRKEKERAQAKYDELAARNAASRKKAVEGRRKTEMRHKIQKVVNELNQYLLKGTKDRHVPIELQKAVAEALDAVDMDTVGAEERIAKLNDELLKAKTPEGIQEISKRIDHVRQMGDRMDEKLNKLKAAYDEFIDSDDPLIANAHDDAVSAHLMRLIVRVGDTPLRDMTIDQLQDVYDVYKIVLATIRNANKSFKDNKNREISTRANQVMAQIDSLGVKRGKRPVFMSWIEKFGWDGLKPVYAMEHIGSKGLIEAYNNVRAGEDTWAQDIVEARGYYLEKFRKYKYDSWDFDKKLRFTSTTGKSFELTLDQIMSLYAYSKRDQAADHLKYGGIVFDPKTEVVEKTKSGIKVKYNVANATAYNINEETLADIISALTDDQKGFVDEMQTYLADAMGAKGNEVSLAMYDVKLFREKNYFPLKSATQYMAKAKEQAQGDVKIKNSGFSKETKPHAKNPIVLSSFMDVWTSHVNEMSMYHAFVLPMEDFYRIYNYTTPSKNENMSTEGVNAYIENAYGAGATGYIEQMLKDLNGGARTDSRTGIINKMMGLFKKGAVFASLSVVVQQPSAIARAAALVDTKYFIGPKVDHMRHKALWDEVKQYAPVAIIKEMGYFDTNMGKSTQDYIMGQEYSGFKAKMAALVKDSNYRDEILSKAPALADEIAWCSIWEAVKRETQAKHPGMDIRSEAFLKMAGERFTEVITKTQVYDSVLSKSAMMRSKDTGMKMATAFMAEPTTSINMIADALLQGKRGNRKYCRTAIGAVIASQILNSILVSFVYAGRDDDEDETYVEKYIGTLTGEILDSLNPAAYIPFIKDIVSIVQGYNVERSDMALISDLWNAWQKLGSDNLSAYRKVEGFVGSIAQIFGLPVKNIMRDARGIYQTVMSFVNGQQTTAAGIGYAVKAAIPEWLGGGETSGQNQLYEAYLSGDKTQIARVESRYKDQSAITSAIRKALRENDSRIREAAQAAIGGNAAERARIAREIEAEGHFKLQDIQAAINAEIDELRKEAKGK